MMSYTSSMLILIPVTFMAFLRHNSTHLPQRVQRLWSTAMPPAPISTAFSGQCATQRPHRAQRVSVWMRCGSMLCESGVEHQRQRRGQPFRNTTVRMPGPSCFEHLSILRTMPSIGNLSLKLRICYVFPGRPGSRSMPGARKGVTRKDGCSPWSLILRRSAVGPESRTDAG